MGVRGPILVLHSRVPTWTWFKQVTKKKAVLLPVHMFDGLIDFLLKNVVSMSKTSWKLQMRKLIEVPTSRVKKGVWRRFIFVFEIKDNRCFYLNSQERTIGSVSVNGFFLLTSHSAISQRNIVTGQVYSFQMLTWCRQPTPWEARSLCEPTPTRARDIINLNNLSSEGPHEARVRRKSNPDLPFRSPSSPLPLRHRSSIQRYFFPNVYWYLM